MLSISSRSYILRVSYLIIILPLYRGWGSLSYFKHRSSSSSSSRTSSMMSNIWLFSIDRYLIILSYQLLRLLLLVLMLLMLIRKRRRWDSIMMMVMIVVMMKMMMLICWWILIWNISNVRGFILLLVFLCMDYDLSSIIFAILSSLHLIELNSLILILLLLLLVIVILTFIDIIIIIIIIIITIIVINKLLLVGECSCCRWSSVLMILIYIITISLRASVIHSSLMLSCVKTI